MQVSTLHYPRDKRLTFLQKTPNRLKRPARGLGVGLSEVIRLRRLPSRPISEMSPASIMTKSSSVGLTRR